MWPMEYSVPGSEEKCYENLSVLSTEYYPGKLLLLCKWGVGETQGHDVSERLHKTRYSVVVVVPPRLAPLLLMFSFLLFVLRTLPTPLAFFLLGTTRFGGGRELQVCVFPESKPPI